MVLQIVGIVATCFSLTLFPWHVEASGRVYGKVILKQTVANSDVLVMP